MIKNKVEISSLVGLKFQSTVICNYGIGGNHKFLLSITDVVTKDKTDCYFKVIVDSFCVITTPTLQTAINVYNKY